MSDNFVEKTDLGQIIVPKSLLAQIVFEEVKRFRGKVYLTNNKGKRPSLVSKAIGSAAQNSISISIEDDNLIIKVYVMIRFGVSISKTVDSLIENIKNRINKNLGLMPKSVSVIVTGTLSKNVAKRNIEVKKNYDVD